MAPNTRWMLLGIQSTEAADDLVMALSMFASGKVNGVEDKDLALEHASRLLERAAAKITVLGGGMT